MCLSCSSYPTGCWASVSTRSGTGSNLRSAPTTRDGCNNSLPYDNTAYLLHVLFGLHFSQLKRMAVHCCSMRYVMLLLSSSPTAKCPLAGFRCQPPQKNPVMSSWESCTNLLRRNRGSCRDSQRFHLSPNASKAGQWYAIKVEPGQMCIQLLGLDSRLPLRAHQRRISSMLMTGLLLNDSCAANSGQQKLYCCFRHTGRYLSTGPNICVVLS